MAEIRLYTSEAAIPSSVREQIRLMVALEWPPGETDAHAPLTQAWLSPTYFVLLDGDTVLSYGRTVSASGTLQGMNVTVYGLGDVVTPECYRRRGYAAAVVAAATAHIRAGPRADLAILHTAPELDQLYARAGWAHAPGLRVVTDEPAGDATSYVMTLLLSGVAKGLLDTAGATLALPGDEW